MKDTKRAYRRHKKQSKFLKRLRNQLSSMTWISNGTNYGFDLVKKETVIQAALKGLCYTNLRTMSTSCSCSMCTYPKYDRTEYKRNSKREIAWGLQEVSLYL